MGVKLFKLLNGKIFYKAQKWTSEAGERLTQTFTWWKI